MTAVGEGISNIMVYSTASANACICVVHVAQTPSSVSLPENLFVEIGETILLSPDVSPSGAAATYTWHTSDPSVASISSDGMLSGVGHGVAVVNCTTQNGVTSNDCHVTVDYRLPTSIQISEDSCLLLVGETHQLTCGILPEGANSNVSWHSCDENIVPVNSFGLIAGYHLGSTMVIATSSNGLQDTCYVRVCQEATGIQLCEGIAVALDAQYTFHPSFIPQDGYANDLQWESDDESVVTVDNGVINAVGLGSTVVRVRNGHGLYAESQVYVKEMTHVNVWLNSGVRYSYPIDYAPKITYVSDCRVYIEAWYLTAVYDIAEVSKITIADESEPWFEMPEPTAVVEHSTASINMQVSNNQVVFADLHPQSSVSVYSVSGRLVNSYKAGLDGSLLINLSTYSTGIYIINTNNQSFKIYIP